ncbi:MAG TPA: DnaA regulatory inactivator Hda [Steroidobacteraceae bacterium]|nr:DnaA regulatory inactivator Hda [Steroidobacteraceae bacterium]
MNQLPLAIRLRERADYDHFVPGPNAPMVDQLKVVARPASSGVYWLTGDAGVGKSHLLQATCAAALAQGIEAVYLSLSQLRQFGPGTLDGWPGARVVALDEIADVLGDREWERALFGLYRDIEERRASLLLAAREPPQRLQFVLPDLSSRLAAAQILTLQRLDDSAQREALRLRAQARGLELPEETALYLQRRYRRELSALYELFDTLEDEALRARRRMTVPFIREVLKARAP